MNKVLYNIDQRNDTSDAQKTTARNNIGAASQADLTAETNRAVLAEKAAKTEVVQGSGMSVSSSTGTDGQTIYTVAADIPEATQSASGLMSASDKTKLDGIASGAEVNVIDTVKVNGTAQTVTNKAVDITVPTNTSQLSNDSGFITASQVPAQVNADWDASSGVAAISNKPTFANEADSVTAIDENTPIVIGYNSTSKKLITRLVSALMSFLGISVSGNTKSFSGKSALAADADHAANADNATNATYGASGTNIEVYFTANTQNISDINTALGNKQPLCNMYIDGTNASSGTAYTETVNARDKGFAPMLNVGGIYLPLAYVSLDPNDSSVMWYHFEDNVTSTNTAYHRIVKPSSITNSDTTLSYTAGTAIDITGNVISTKVKSGGGISVDPSDGLYVPKVEVTFTLTNNVVTSDKTYQQLFLYIYNGYFVDAKLIRGSDRYTLLSRNVSVNGNGSFGSIEFTFFETTGNISKTVFEGVYRVVVSSDRTVSYRQEVLAPQPPYFTYKYVNGSWEFKTWQNREECTLTEFLNMCNNTAPGKAGSGLLPFGVIHYADGSNVYVPLSYGYFKDGEYHFMFSTTYHDVMSSQVKNMLVTAIVDSDGIDTNAFEV